MTVHLHSGKFVDKHLGRGAIVAIGSESVACLRGVYVNGSTQPAVVLTLTNNTQEVMGEFADTSTEHLRKRIIERFGDEHVVEDGYLTEPMMTRSNVSEAWTEAAEMLETLSRAARERAAELMQKPTGPGGEIVREPVKRARGKQVY